MEQNQHLQNQEKEGKLSIYCSVQSAVMCVLWLVCLVTQFHRQFVHFVLYKSQFASLILRTGLRLLWTRIKD